MGYQPSVRDVYEHYTDSDYRNNSLLGCRRETFVEAAYRLNQEYVGLETAFDPVGADGHYGYVVQDGDDRPVLRAHTLLSRYLSAVYRVIEAMRVCLSTATGEPMSSIRLHPETRSALSRWDSGGQQPESHVCDKVMARFTYLRGVRNAVVHGSYDCFDAEQTTDWVVVSLNPDTLDDDSALSGYDPDHEPTTYTFTDTYLRFEDETEARYPVDNVVKYHRSVVFPFVRAFENEL